MNEQQEIISKWIQQNKGKGIRLLKKLVQEPSLQGNEGSSQAIIIEKCRELGLEIDIWEPSGSELIQHPYFVSPRTSFTDSPNIVAVLKGEGGGRSLLLNGHIDVVPEGDRTNWHVDPYSAEIKDGKLYGRGSTDMKGGNVSLLLAIEAIKESGIKLKGDIIFQSVIEEESGGAGTLATILKGYKADGAIIPEPTNMKIFPKQQGSLWFKVDIRGRSAHGGTRYEGISAIEKSMVVIKHILKLEMMRNAAISDPLYKNTPIPVPINIGKISGGTWPSSVPDLVTIEGRMGVAPEETIENAKAEMKQWLEKLPEIDSWFHEYPARLEWFGARWVPGTIDIDHELMNLLTTSYKQVKKVEPIIEASPWGTDGGLLTAVGNIPTIIFGPGTTEVAHYPNEYIELEKMFEAAEIIAHTILAWCEVSDHTC
ncbi:peptidase [Fredinandcohnia sp. 179-A 10B2 NHS]|uniref:peptidase n=1 Tax=Fredinandcohnia sp. 179-A 10B2 NHS TaxID=3235176 RepID=UPI0039A3DEBE